VVEIHHLTAARRTVGRADMPDRRAGDVKDARGEWQRPWGRRRTGDGRPR
jgi:hypothetical protein